MDPTAQHSLVSVIVPAFNEEDSLEELCLRIKKTFDKLDRSFELIIIDDGSTDKTLEKLNSLLNNYPNIIVIRHFKNNGKSLALMQGFDIAKGEVAISIDADLQNPPEEIPSFLNKIEAGYDCVNGYRKDRKDKWNKRLFSEIFNYIVSWVFKTRVKDVNCGLKAYNQKVYKWLNLRGDLHRLIPIIVTHKGFKVVEIPVEHHKRKYGVSKYRLVRHRGLLDIIALGASTTTQIRPFHVFCELSSLFWVLAFIFFALWITTKELLSLAGQILIGGISIWAIVLGTFLPFFGLFLEVEASRFQGLEWRKSLIKELLFSDK